MCSSGENPRSTLAMPVKSIFPNLGKKCGRREREADARCSQREQSFWRAPSSRRWKAPRSSERWCPSRGTFGTRVSVGPSRFVRGLFPRRMDAPMTVGCSLGAEEGNVVSVTLKAYAPDASGGHAKRDSRGHVLHSVQRPVHVSRHYTSGGESRTKVTRFSGHRGWANPRKWEEPTPGPRKSDEECAARHVPPVPQGMQRGAIKKRKEVAASVPARKTRAPVRARTS